MIESKWVTVQGISMHALASAHEQARHRLPIVIIPGFVVGAGHAVPAIRQLAPHHPVYAPDLPGFGRSDKPKRVLDWVELSDALAGWMDGMGIPRAAIVGGSVGAQIVSEFCVRHPGKVEKVILAGPTIDPEARTLLKQFARWIINGQREGIASKDMVRDYMAAGPRRVVRMVGYALKDRIEDRLPQIEAPSLVVRGARDPIVPQRWAEEVARLLPRGRLVVVPGATHSLLFAAPEGFATKVLPFLQEGL